jgi:protein-disulfide isomerase
MEHKKHEEQKAHKSHAPKKHAKEDTITITKVGLWQGVAGVLALLLIVSIFTGGFNGQTEVVKEAAGNQPTAAAGNQPSAPSAPAADVDMEELADGYATKGDLDAPVTIVEFSDFECPFCARFYSDTLGQIESEYVDTGKVRFVYRHFPLSFHPNAGPSAEAFECARLQDEDAAWAMHDDFFENGVAGGVASFKALAGELGLNQEEFDSCLDNGDMAAAVQADFQAGQAAGVTGTPGFLINGQVVAGAQPYSVFKQIIDAQLS